MVEPLPGASRAPRHVGEGLERVVKSMGAPSASGLRALFDEWPDVAGAALASHCRPVSIDGHTLVLAVEDPAWASELQWLRSPLLESIAKVIGPGVITEVKLRVDRA
jgi:predicted nucleic acid-binding Zn ribbon protein